MTLEIIITSVFLLLAVWVLGVAAKVRNTFGMIHALFFVLFATGLHFVGLFSEGDREYDLVYYLTAHLVVFLYMVLFTFGMLWATRLEPASNLIINSALSVRDAWLIFAFSAWLVIKGYLVLRYGLSAFSLFRNLAGEYAIYHFAWWETPIEIYVRAFAVGACAIYVIKAVTLKGYWKDLRVTAPFLLFTAVYINTHESIVGPRRFLLLLILVALSILAQRARKTLPRYLITRWRNALIAVVLGIGLAYYYQTIRNNFFEPDIAYSLRSSNPVEFTKGVFKAMLPLPTEQRIGGERTKFFREGPFDIIYRIIEKRGEGNRGTGGAIVANAFLTVVPRVIVGESKKDINADDILAAQMSITPEGPYLVSDVATSLLAIFLADFGLLGVFIPPFIILASLTFFSSIPRRRSIASPLLVLFWFFALVHLAGNIEGSLVAVLSTFRNAIILMIVIVPVSVMTHRIRRNINRRARDYIRLSAPLKKNSL